MTPKTQSYWQKNGKTPSFTPLKGDVNVDVAIIGAGITGLTTALLLKESGKKVAVIDQYNVAGGESGRTTAHITALIDSRYHSIQSKFGKEAAKQVAESSLAAMRQIAKWIDHFHIACDFEVLPAYHYATSAKDVSELQDELTAAQSAGLNPVWQREVPLPFKTLGALYLKNQGQFHPRKYLLALARKLSAKENAIFEYTRALEIEEGEPCRITTDRGVISSSDIIIATNTPISNRFFLHTKVAAYRTYAITGPLSQPPSESALYWDNTDPYHYIRNHDRLWIVGGEDHKTGHNDHTEESFRRLIDFGESMLGMKSVPYRWSGQIMETVDGLPLIGRNSFSDHIYVATGYSGNGITFGTLAGMILSDLLLQKSNAWADLYSPTRIKPLAAALSYIVENVDYPMHLIKDRLFQNKSESVSSLANGEGTVIERRGERIAVSRDGSGKLHETSAVCPHLGCLVHWNNAEQSWDCPCHGSRFNQDGKVLNGPAMSDLTPKLRQLKPEIQRKRAA